MTPDELREVERSLLVKNGEIAGLQRKHAKLVEAVRKLQANVQAKSDACPGIVEVDVDNFLLPWLDAILAEHGEQP
jgi:hypothetical protein